MGKLRVFLSYARESQAVARSLAEDLGSLGHAVWFDQSLTGGQSWWNEILSQIRDCDVFVVLLSPESLDSTACTRERHYASSLQRNIVPVRISESVGFDSLPPALASIQYLDYVRQDKAEFKAIARTCSLLPQAAPLPNPLPEPPAVPVSYLASLKEQVESPERLSFDEQAALVFRLKDGLDDARDAAASRALLERMLRREDLLSRVAEDIKSLLQADKPPPAATGSNKPSAGEASRPEQARSWRPYVVAVTVAVSAYFAYLVLDEQVPATCSDGLVPRLAAADDAVCVSPESQEQVAVENEKKVLRWRHDDGGDYGAHTCIEGYVWREAFEGDTVCVTPERREEVLQENAAAQP